MSWALGFLELGADADERAVKRAYAQRLKRVRPDVDPQGFQRLHEAYQAALGFVQHRDAQSEEAFEDEAFDDAPGDTHVAIAVREADTRERIATPVAASTPNQAEAEADVGDEGDITFDAGAFIDECIERLGRDHPDGIDGWLKAQPALWSLQLKPMAGRWLLQALHERTPPVPSDNLDRVLRFFDLDHVLSGVDAYFLQQLRRQLNLRHELLPGNERVLGNRVLSGTDVHERRDRAVKMMRQLRSPFRWPRALWFGLPWGRAQDMRRFVLGLDEGEIDHLGEAIDLRQARFWLDAGDRPRLSLARRMIVAARCVFVVQLFVVLAMGLRWSSRAIPDAQWPAELGQALALLVGGPLAAYAACEAAFALTAYVRWQCSPEQMALRYAPLRWAWVPLLATLAVLANHVLDQEAAARTFALIAFATALMRMWSRAHLQFRFGGSGWWWIILAVPLLKLTVGAVALLILFSDVAAGLALLCWLIDAVRHRAWLWAGVKSLFGRAAADSVT